MLAQQQITDSAPLLSHLAAGWNTSERTTTLAGKQPAATYVRHATLSCYTHSDDWTATRVMRTPTLPSETRRLRPSVTGPVQHRGLSSLLLGSGSRLVARP